MKTALHGLTVRYSNAATDIRIASECGYDAVELHTDKLDRYMAAGFPAEHMKDLLKKHGMKVSCIDIIGDVETRDGGKKQDLFARTEKLCRAAAAWNCPTIQLNGFSELEGLPEKEIIRLTARNIREICRIGEEFGIRFQYEGAAWTPLHTLDHCLALAEEVNRPNFGLVIDYWHFWASRGALPEDIRKLDRELLYGVHIADGYRPDPGAPWPEETELRGALPGEGNLPVKEWTEAVLATGYDGYFSGEILNHQLWERDLKEIAGEMRERMLVLA